MTTNDTLDARNTASGLSRIGAIHDLGNLIQVAQSAVTLIDRRTDGVLPREIAHLFAGARAALDHAGAIVRQSLACSRTGAAALEHVDITSCIADIGILVQPMLDAAIRLHARTSSNTLAVTTNRIALQNAVLNLIMNARDAMPSGGVILLVAKDYFDKDGASYVEISILDTGAGMSQDMVARVFDPHFTTKRDGTGGVGLPMVKRFVSEAGGSISITSALGAGTTATLRLPSATIFPDQRQPRS